MLSRSLCDGAACGACNFRLNPQCSCMASRFLLLVACMGLVTGCLEFEQQTLTYRYDAKTDTLRIFQSYQGIFGADGNDGLSKDELEQLNSVLTGQRTFFFSNWVWEFNRDAL